MDKRYEKILEPGLIGNVHIRNRTIWPAMIRNYANLDGSVNKKTIDHFAERSKGGAGLIITGAACISREGRSFPNQLAIDRDEMIVGLANLAEAIKAYGAAACIQLHHTGRQTSSENTGLPVVAPSAIASPGLPVPKELTTEECQALVEAYAQSARRAVIAGFDAVELHAAHGYLVSQFLSPRTNKRTDKYGGDLNGRMTFLMETIRRIREVIGSRIGLIVRLNSEDYLPGGIPFEEGKATAIAVAETGLVDALQISGGTYEQAALNPIPGDSATCMLVPRAHFMRNVAEIKKAVNIPILCSNAMTPELAEEFLEKGELDFVGFGRSMFADSELVNKLRKGQREDIRPCIRCNEFCIGKESITGVRCTVNPECGHEDEGPLRKATPPKRVIIIGGGVAGMEAARVATLRGHKVSLYEKSDKLGGHLHEASVPTFKADLGEIKNWLLRQMDRLHIDVHLNEEFTSDCCRNDKPDTIIVATGSNPLKPHIPGIDGKNVIAGIDLLLGKAEVGENVIVAGGGAVGCETAIWLSEQGKNVTVVEMMPEVVSDSPVTRATVLEMLKRAGVKLSTDTKITAFDEKGISALDKNRNPVRIEGDSIVLAMGMVPNSSLYNSVKDLADDVYVIGDAIHPRRVGDAIHSAYRIASII